MKNIVAIMLILVALTVTIYADPNEDLIQASLTEDLELVIELVESGADVNYANSYGQTALEYASGNLEIVLYLIQQGANPNTINNWDVSPLGYAISYDEREIIDALMEAGADPFLESDNMIQAALSGNLDLVIYFMEMGVDINTPGKAGGTAVMRAAEGGHIEVVKYLLEYSPKLNVIDEFGETALSYAEEYGHQNIATLLRANGATQ